MVPATDYALYQRLVLTAQVCAFVEAVVVKKGRIDHLVNCAGGLAAVVESASGLPAVTVGLQSPRLRAKWHVHFNPLGAPG